MNVPITLVAFVSSGALIAEGVLAGLPENVGELVGTTGLIMILLVAVRHLVKRDESKDEKLAAKDMALVQYLKEERTQFIALMTEVRGILEEIKDTLKRA